MRLWFLGLKALYPRFKVRVLIFCFSRCLFLTDGANKELRDAPGVNLVLYDTTLMYVDSKTGDIELKNGFPVSGPSLLSLVLGKPSADIHLHVKRYTMDQLPKTDKDLGEESLFLFSSCLTHFLDRRGVAC